MLKNLFDFKMRKPLVIAKSIMLIFFVAAIVIFCFGVKEIIDVKHMKTLLNTNKPTMGMILNFLAGKHLGWAGCGHRRWCFCGHPLCDEQQESVMIAACHKLRRCFDLVPQDAVKTINKGYNRENSGVRPEFLLPALSAAANPVIYVYVNSRISRLDALSCSLS